jgi:hypothetical protein
LVSAALTKHPRLMLEAVVEGIMKEAGSERIERDSEGLRKRRRPYESPQIISVEPLEGVAGVCTGRTAKSTPIQCRYGPISS